MHCSRAAQQKLLIAGEGEAAVPKSTPSDGS
jgi:hypothetical protein